MEASKCASKAPVLVIFKQRIVLLNNSWRHSVDKPILKKNFESFSIIFQRSGGLFSLSGEGGKLFGVLRYLHGDILGYSVFFCLHGVGELGLWKFL